VEIDPNTGEAVDHRLSKISAAEWEQLKTECPVYTFTTITEFFNALEKQRFFDSNEGVLLLDSDNSLRPHPYLKIIRGSHFGEIPRSIFEHLVSLYEKYHRHWSMAVVTNQPENGHQIAWAVERWQHVPVMPHSVRRAGIPVLGSDWLFMFHINKSSDRGIKRTVEWIMDNKIKPLLDAKIKAGDLRIATLQMVGEGDRETDMEFYRQVAYHLNQKLQKLGLSMIQCQWKLFMVGKPDSANDMQRPREEKDWSGLARFFARLRP
jgi:hypothetical protein